MQMHDGASFASHASALPRQLVQAWLRDCIGNMALIILHSCKVFVKREFVEYVSKHTNSDRVSDRVSDRFSDRVSDRVSDKFRQV